MTSDTGAIDALQRLIGLMRSRPPLPEKERAQKQHEYFHRAFDQMVSSGKTYGEVTGSPGTAVTSMDYDEFRRHLRSIDNDLATHVGIVAEGVHHYFEHGEIPAPYYAWRIAVILRKANLVTLEADFLEAFNKICAGRPGGRYSDLVDREGKARKRAATQKG